MRKFLLMLLSIATLAWLGLPRPGQAQILLVTGNYRVVELDQAHERFGVALPEADPKVRQNWVYLTPSTGIQWRYTNRQGWHKEEKMSYGQFFEQIKPGQMLRIQGGRRWDGEITAKQMWIGFPEKKD